MAWRVAKSLGVLRDEVNGRWSARDTSSDGMIGDAAHASTGSASDHNPWVVDSDGRGVVRAFDIDVDLDGDSPSAADADALAEQLRSLGAAGDVRLVDGGYIIYNERIASENGAWAWRPYDGADPHTSHIHLSVSRDAVGYDDVSAWGVGAAPHPPEATDMLTPAICQTDDGVYHAFGVGVDKKVYESVWDGHTWQGPSEVGGEADSGVGVTTDGRRIDITVVAKNKMFHAFKVDAAHPWSGFDAVPGTYA